MIDTEFLAQVNQAATDAGHPFPFVTACEAALTTNFGMSPQAVLGNNLFKLQGSVEFPIQRARMKLYSSIGSGLASSYWPVFNNYTDCLQHRLSYLAHRSQWDDGIVEAMRLAYDDSPIQHTAAYIKALATNVTTFGDPDVLVEFVERYRKIFARLDSNLKQV